MTQHTDTGSETGKGDAVSQILTGLALAISKDLAEDTKQELIKKALNRLRPLYVHSKHLFTANVLRQIQEFKACIILPGPQQTSRNDENNGNTRIPVEAVVLPSFLTVGAVLQRVGSEIRRTFPTKLW